MITTSKLNNSIAFSRTIFWEPTADEMGAEDWGTEDKGRGPRAEEHKHPYRIGFLFTLEVNIWAHFL